jgi:hypothetical protein
MPATWYDPKQVPGNTASSKSVSLICILMLSSHLLYSSSCRCSEQKETTIARKRALTVTILLRAFICKHERVSSDPNTSQNSTRNSDNCSLQVHPFNIARVRTMVTFNFTFHSHVSKVYTAVPSIFYPFHVDAKVKWCVLEADRSDMSAYDRRIAVKGLTLWSPVVTMCTTYFNIQ